jgi:hypothetical protein
MKKNRSRKSCGIVPLREICLVQKGQDNPASFNLSAFLSYSEVLHFNRFQILISSLKGTVEIDTTEIGIY